MKTSLVVLSLFVVSACTTHKTMVPISGSKADGIVKMAYDYALLESPMINREASQEQAVKRCNAWGYSDAEAFGTSSKQCIENNGFGCERFRVITEYQCTGSYNYPTQQIPSRNVSQSSYAAQPGQQIIINIPASTQQEVTLQPINRH
ncbi:hypothetical protein HMPREF2907_04305 [Neisseria sp. HMSC055H02]|nr:hypothetical protein HMPREF2907_04305 [Neisseria sp. HMSC055H02]